MLQFTRCCSLTPPAGRTVRVSVFWRAGAPVTLMSKKSEQDLSPLLSSPPSLFQHAVHRLVLGLARLWCSSGTSPQGHRLRSAILERKGRRHARFDASPRRPKVHSRCDHFLQARTHLQHLDASRLSRAEVCRRHHAQLNVADIDIDSPCSNVVVSIQGNIDMPSNVTYVQSQVAKSGFAGHCKLEVGLLPQGIDQLFDRVRHE